jgi:N utilization substance protein B
MSAPAAREFSGTRTVARKLALQALYRWQLNECPWQDLVNEFSAADDMGRADGEFFRALLEGVCSARGELDVRLAAFTDREPRLLDPIEHVRAAVAAGRAVPRHHQRGGGSCAALRRD